MENIQSYLAADFFKDSSSLPRTDRRSTDLQLVSISEKLNSLKIATQQLKLNQEVYKVGVEYQKQIQSQKLYETSIVESEISQIHHDQFLAKRDLGLTGLKKIQLQLDRSNLENGFYETETKLSNDFWTEKLKLVESRIDLIRSSQKQIEAKIENFIDV